MPAHNAADEAHPSAVSGRDGAAPRGRSSIVDGRVVLDQLVAHHGPCPAGHVGAGGARTPSGTGASGMARRSAGSIGRVPTTTKCR
jgi:hypothetical protein